MLQKDATLRVGYEENYTTKISAEPTRLITVMS